MRLLYRWFHPVQHIHTHICFCVVLPPSVRHERVGSLCWFGHYEHTMDGPLYQLHVLKTIFPCGCVLVSSFFGYTCPRHQKHCLSYGLMLIFARPLVFSWYRTCLCTCRTEHTQWYVANHNYFTLLFFHKDAWYRTATIPGIPSVRSSTSN